MVGFAAIGSACWELCGCWAGERHDWTWVVNAKHPKDRYDVGVVGFIGSYLHVRVQ
jgi:hypothetical protein